MLVALKRVCLEVGLQIRALKLHACRDLTNPVANLLACSWQLFDSVSCCSCAGPQHHFMGDVRHFQLGSVRGATQGFSTRISKEAILF